MVLEGDRRCSPPPVEVPHVPRLRLGASGRTCAAAARSAEQRVCGSPEHRGRPLVALVAQSGLPVRLLLPFQSAGERLEPRSDPLGIIARPSVDEKASKGAQDHRGDL